MRLDQERKIPMVCSLAPSKIAMVQANMFLLERPSHVCVTLTKISAIFFLERVNSVATLSEAAYGSNVRLPMEAFLRLLIEVLLPFQD